MKSCVEPFFLAVLHHFCPQTHARNGYYDNLKFHRVIKGFMIQVCEAQHAATMLPPVPAIERYLMSLSSAVDRREILWETGRAGNRFGAESSPTSLTGISGNLPLLPHDRTPRYDGYRLQTCGHADCLDVLIILRWCTDMIDPSPCLWLTPVPILTDLR